MHLRRVDPTRDSTALRRFLVASDPNDYLLEGLEGWVHDGRLWVGTEGDRWVAFGRLHDLGHHDGWVSGLRVAADSRGRGLGRELLRGLVDDARRQGIRALRAVIEEPNLASRRLFTRDGFAPAVELTLRRGPASGSGTTPLRRATPREGLGGSVEWLAEATGLVDLLPGEDGGRFGLWRPELVDRWIEEGKLYVGPGLALAVLTDWWPDPRTMWVSFLRGTPGPLVEAASALAHQLDQSEWQTFLPFGKDRRAEYEALGLTPHPYWGDKVHLYSRTFPGPE